MGYYWKLFLFFGCSLIGIWIMGWLARISDPTPLSYDLQVLNILLPIVGSLIVVFCYVYYKGIDIEAIKSFINKLKRKK